MPHYGVQVVSGILPEHVVCGTTLIPNNNAPFLDDFFDWMIFQQRPESLKVSLLICNSYFVREIKDQSLI